MNMTELTAKTELSPI